MKKSKRKPLEGRKRDNQYTIVPTSRNHQGYFTAKLDTERTKSACRFSASSSRDSDDGSGSVVVRYPPNPYNKRDEPPGASSAHLFGNMLE